MMVRTQRTDLQVSMDENRDKSHVTTIKNGWKNNQTLKKAFLTLFKVVVGHYLGHKF